MTRKQYFAAPPSKEQPTLHSPTRRRFLGMGLVAGVGTLLGASRFAWAQTSAHFYKGVCYSAFPAPYNESTANKTCIFFGSDIAYDCMEPLWGTGFTSKSGMKFAGGRNDLKTIKDMGVNLIRLYDWDLRNHHLNFLNYCSQLGIKVLAPVSNYHLKPGTSDADGFRFRQTNIPKLIKSFSNAAGTDYHPAIAAIIMGNEPRLNKFTANECSEFTKDWVKVEAAIGFKSEPPIGHPVDFSLAYGGGYPAWGFWERLLKQLHNTTQRNLQNRLFLAPQPQNTAYYLFENAESSGKGFVQLTHAKFGKPLLFTELGHDRTKKDYLEVVKGQLKASIAYGTQHPKHLLGICHFQFDDKVWLCPTGGICPTEGSFGVFSHTNQVLVQVTYIDRDFTHSDGVPCINQQLKVDRLTRNPVYDVVRNAYVFKG